MNRYLTCVYKCVFVSHHNGSLLAMVPVELQHVFERKITDDVRVEDKKWLIVDVEQLSGQRQRTRCGEEKRESQHGTGKQNSFHSSVNLAQSH